MTRPTTTGKAQDLITFTRSTTGTALAKISYGEELVTNGDFSSGSTGWNVSQVGTFEVVSGRAKITSSSGNQRIYQEITGFSVGKAYTLSLELEGAYAVYVSTSSTSGGSIANIPYVGSTAPLVSKQLTFTATSSTLNLVVYVIGTNNNVFIDNVSVKEVLYDQPDGTLQLFNHPINKPRIEYDASGNCLGLLVEEARTNALLQSGDIGAWGGSVGSKTNVTLTENAITAPDGTQTADKVQRTVLDTPADYRQNLPVTSGNDYTFSIFAKADVQARLELDFSNSKFTSQDYVRFDVDTGTAYGSGSGATYSITNYGNGWYRFSLTATCTESGDTGVIARITNNEPHYAWGAQFEVGSFPTSYIPTSGSTVTRAADVASLAVSEFGYNQDQGSVVVEAKRFGTSNQFPRIAQFNDGSASNRIGVSIYGSSNTAYGSCDNGGVNQASLHEVAATGPNVYAKIGFGFGVNNFGFIVDSIIEGTDTSGSPPSNITQMQIGTRASGQYLNGYIKSIQYYPLRLSNAQLQALTV